MYLKIPDHHSSIQTHSAVFLHFGFLSRHNAELPAGPSKTYEQKGLLKLEYISFVLLYEKKKHTKSYSRVGMLTIE